MSHIANRDRIIETLRAELIGPAPLGVELDCNKDVIFPAAEDSYQPFRQAGSGEEILQRDAPLNRYGAGVLYPYGARSDDEAADSFASLAEVVNITPDAESDGATPITEQTAQAIAEKQEKLPGSATDDADLDLSAANKYLPSSLGISFLAEIPAGASLVVEAIGGRYVKKQVTVEGKTRAWWLRVPVRVEARFDGAKLLQAKGKVSAKGNVEGLNLCVEVFARPQPQRDRALVTVCLVNRTPQTEGRDAACLFQTHFCVAVVTPDGPAAHILPYPEADAQQLDEEEQSLALLYRFRQTYAVGHGCAADWQDATDEGHATFVSAECFPVCETPSITPDGVTRADGSPLQISMAALAGLRADSDGWADLEALVEAYESWIEQRQCEVPALETRYQAAAERHLADATRCVARMRDGLEFLRQDAQARLAFQLANHAVLLQQARSQRNPRTATYDTAARRLVFSEPYPAIDPLNPGPYRGQWRAFQIAFLLMTVRSTANGDAPDRETVELIWFPTGGGKTEAYLGLTAFSLLLRRLRNPADTGVRVLMRYTLRLLTAQQFQRACGLICALEHLRRQDPQRLGEQQFSIAVWLGGSVTPNTRADACHAFNELQRHPRTAENKFILTRCPWCRAQLGLIKVPGGARGRRASGDSFQVFGYERRGDTVVFACTDAHCDFNRQLPVYVVDEDIYEERPSLVIGTVDKFAMLAWRPEARALFGRDAEGQQMCAPPGLIIQDELHLISGPLGSVVGLYETLIEELCTDRRCNGCVSPKIISSTATIRRYQAQIQALYARPQTALFPPPGLHEGDSFFARYARRADGTLQPGRKYVGVNAPGLGSLQNTEVRTYTALLQAPAAWTPEERDPWWTLLVFFNNLRMLGNTLSLFQSYVPAYVRAYNNRTRQTPRYIDRVEELTGRLRSDQVPDALAKLEVECTDATRRAVDVCLASSIIEVGVDVDRLSLMVVVGQPKSTSQYIQVTGRVGRKWYERPGVVVSLYSPSKPRDRSHFEKFRSYHERLYAQVEPTSVTPFAPPVLERALHAVMAGYVRQTGGAAETRSPYPFPLELLEDLQEILQPRVALVDAAEQENFRQVFARRCDEWRRWQRTRWDRRGEAGDTPLLRPAGEYTQPTDELISWSTQQSMRNVDAEADAEITALYLNHEGIV